jgi:hypothetical protein
MTARTFEICRQAVEAGADPAAIARAVYDNNGLGRVKLLGSLLNAMTIDASGRFATLTPPKPPHAPSKRSRQ